MSNKKLKIGKFVKRYIVEIFEYCKQNPDEFERLQNKEISKDTFDINYPFCTKTSNIISAESRRYWGHEYTVFDVDVRCSSQWFDEDVSKSRKNFAEYLISKKIATKKELSCLIENVGSQKPNHIIKRKKNSRYRGWAIGNAQNLVIRNILSNLGEETFSADDWKKTKNHFGNKCAYCGSEDILEMEHAIPINRKQLGEHRLGNIVPSCKACNKKKHSQNYIEFLGSDNTRIDLIESYMADKGYVLIKEKEQLRAILETAYDDVGRVAERYIKLINKLHT